MLSCTYTGQRKLNFERPNWIVLLFCDVFRHSAFLQMVLQLRETLLSVPNKFVSTSRGVGIPKSRTFITKTPPLLQSINFVVNNPIDQLLAFYEKSLFSMYSSVLIMMLHGQSVIIYQFSIPYKKLGPT